jgi:hypothetical protein
MLLGFLPALRALLLIHVQALLLGDVLAAAQHSRSHEPAWKQFLIQSFLHARVSPHLIYFVQCQPFQGVLQQWHIH